MMEETRKSVRILAIDDHIAARNQYATCLRNIYHLELADSAQVALEKAKVAPFDLYITDLMMPGMDGIQFIRKLKKLQPDAGIIVVSQTEEIDLAIGAFREKPLDFLRKPIRNSLLLNAIEKNLEMRQLQSKLAVLTSVSAKDANCPEPVLGDSPEMKVFWETTQQIAQSTINPAILICGESGTGKEVVARCLHQWSNRTAGPFIAMNCGLLSPNLTASELMGVEKGVATGVERSIGKFRAADGGTLFLDEIAELPLDVQPMLLRVLQERVVVPVGGYTEYPVNIRVIAATNKDLRQLVTQRLFREDLFYRIAVVRLDVPPLRNRKSDILALLQHLYRRHGGSGILPMSDSEIKQWIAYDWPGNIRQLENALLSRIISGNPINLTLSAATSLDSSRPDMHEFIKGKTWEQIRSEVFTCSLNQAEGNIRQAARALDIPKSTLWEFFKKNQPIS